VRILALLIVLLALEGGCARVKPPPSLRHRLFTLRIDTHREHGCSRSFVTYRHEGTLRLDLEHHRAALELDLTLDTTFSRSRFDVANQRRDRQRWRYTWRGALKRQGAKLTLRLLPARSRCEALPLYGDKGGATIRCRPVANLSLTCEVKTAPIYGPTPRGGIASQVGTGERPTPTSALLCFAPEKLPEVLPEALEQTIPFSHSPGLTLYSSRRPHVFDQRSVLRRR